jgi:aminomethyltransferase
MTTPERLYHLALRELHTAAGATFVVRDGWSLPGSYGDSRAEHAALRGSAAVFDRSNRSRLLVTGTDAMDVLAAVFEGHVNELEEGRAMRTVALDEAGNIRDIVLIARTGGIAYLVSGEPGQRFETLGRLQGAVQAGFDARVDDRTESTCLIGLAGPAAGEVARTQLSSAVPARLQTLHCLTFEFHGFRTLVMRTSDTGEDGFEFMVAPAVAQHMIETLRGAGVALAGQVALECARVEACVPAFDPDLTPGLSPAEADLDVLLGIPGGREGRILSALIIDSEEVAAAGTTISMDGRDVGEMRSCVRSFGLNATIGLGIIDTREALPGRTFSIAGTAAVIVAKPFLRRRQAG